MHCLDNCDEVPVHVKSDLDWFSLVLAIMCGHLWLAVFFNIGFTHMAALNKSRMLQRNLQAKGTDVVHSY